MNYSVCINLKTVGSIFMTLFSCGSSSPPLEDFGRPNRNDASIQLLTFIAQHQAFPANIYFL